MVYTSKSSGTGLERITSTVLIYNCFCTIGLIMSIYIRYDLYLKWNISRGTLIEYDTLWGTGQWKFLVIEILLVIVAPYPYLYNITFQEYNIAYNTWVTYNVSFSNLIVIQINDVLMFISFIRVYVIARFYLVSSQYMNPRSMRVCLIYGCSASSMFAVKVNRNY